MQSGSDTIEQKLLRGTIAVPDSNGAIALCCMLKPRGIVRQLAGKVGSGNIVWPDGLPECRPNRTGRLMYIHQRPYGQIVTHYP